MLMLQMVNEMIPIRPDSTVMSASHNYSDSACKLCSKINPKRKALRDMKEHKQFHIVFEWLHKNEPSLNETDYICLPCVKQIQRGHNKPSFIP